MTKTENLKFAKIRDISIFRTISLFPEIIQQLNIRPKKISPVHKERQNRKMKIIFKLVIKLSY